MRGTIRRRFGAYGVLASVVVAFFLVTPSTAQAYDNNALFFDWVTVNTSNCVAVEQNFDSQTSAQGDYCVVPDEVDGTRFHKDPGGEAMKLVIRNVSGQMLGKVEWHPYGEHLWIYDTKNDGDTFYFATHPCCGWAGFAFAPPGTSAVVDYRDVDMDYPEDLLISLWVYDDSNLTDDVFAYGCKPAQPGCYGGIS